jgi:large subunit ribosomal protein L7Ae
LNHVTSLVEQKKAKFVAIASDVDPIELVLWLPALCRRQNVPYCFVRGTAELGQLCHQKNASCLAIVDVRKEDEGEVNNLATAFRANFNDNTDMRKKIGGFQKGQKSQIKFDRLQSEKEKETIKKAQGV